MLTLVQLMTQIRVCLCLHFNVSNEFSELQPGQKSLLTMYLSIFAMSHMRHNGASKKSQSIQETVVNGIAETC